MSWSSTTTRRTAPGSSGPTGSRARKRHGRAARFCASPQVQERTGRSVRSRIPLGFGPRLPGVDRDGRRFVASPGDAARLGPNDGTGRHGGGFALCGWPHVGGELAVETPCDQPVWVLVCPHGHAAADPGCNRRLQCPAPRGRRVCRPPPDSVQRLHVSDRAQTASLARGFVLEEVPFVFTERDSGESKMSKAILWGSVWKVWKLRLLDVLGRL